MCVQRGRVALCCAALVFLLVVLAGAAVSLSAASGAISITPETVVLEVDQSASLIASRSNVTWSSSNTAVATVDSRGLVTAKAAGTASITARSRGSRGTAKITVNTNSVSRAPLALTCPTAINAVSQDGNPVAVNYAVSYSGGVNPVSVAGVPASGSLFAVGTTSVNVTAQSGDGQRATCSFAVTVTSNYVPPAPLTLTCPTPINAVSQDGNPVAVNYSVSHDGGVDPVSVAGVPASGSSFAVGTTAVNVTGQSGDGQLATCSFDVTVTYTPVVGSPAEPSEPTFGQIMAGIRPRGFGANPYTLLMPAAGRIAYYVSTTGSDTNPGTSTAPFRTINKAAQVALAGDVVTIKSGTYSETVTVKNGGTLSAPIVFQAEVHGGVVMSGGTHFFQPINWSLGINNSGAIYVTVRGLVFRNYTYLGETGTQATYDALRAARGWRIEDCLFDSPGENAVNLRGDDITLTRNTLQFAGRHAIIAYGPPNGATSPTDPAFIGIKNLKITDNIIWSNATATVTQTAVNSSTVVKVMTSKNALIENNESYANAGPGFWLDGRNFGYTIRYNYFHDNVYKGSGYSPGRGLDLEINWYGTVRRNVFAGNAHDGVGVLNTSGVLIEDNLFSRNRRNVLLSNQDRGTAFPCRDNTVRNNLFRDWVNMAGVDVLGNVTPSNAVSVLNLQVDSNTYQPVTSKTLSGYWGYFITTLTQDCSDIGWECHGKTGTIAWPPQ